MHHVALSFPSMFTFGEVLDTLASLKAEVPSKETWKEYSSFLTGYLSISLQGNARSLEPNELSSKH